MNEEYEVRLIIGISMIAIGVLVYAFKLDWMISGYNTLSKEKKANIKTDKIRTLFSNLLVFAGGVLCFNVLISYLTNVKFVHPIVIIFIVVSFLITNYSIGKYDGNEEGGMLTIYKLFRHSKKH